MKDILIASPAGSGMNFALEIIHLSFDAKTQGLGHERSDIETDKHKIILLRNPYDAIASGTERWLDTSNHKTFIDSGQPLINISDTDLIKNMIYNESKRYFNFFNDIEKVNNKKIVTFDTLINDSDLFVNIAEKYFEIQKPRISVSNQDVFDSLSKKGLSNRTPRDKNNSRSIVDNLVKDMYPKKYWDCWDIYTYLYPIVKNEEVVF